MTENDVQLADVSDNDRFLIIDLYKQSPELWCRDVGAGRDKTLIAWNFIAENVSKPGRTFPVPLVQKVVKNLRDQYTRLQRRGCSSSWKFLNHLHFLGNNSSPSSKRSNNFNDRITHKKRKTSTSPLSFVKIEEKPFSVDQLIRPIEFPSSDKLFANNDEPMCSESSDDIAVSSVDSRDLKYNISTVSKQQHDIDEGNVKLSQVSETDRMKIVDLYRECSVLWTKGRNASKEEISDAWSFIQNGVSTPDRQFGIQLVKNITKNLRDQYVRLQRRGGANRTNWRFLQPLSFLGTNPTFNSKKPAQDSNVDNEIKKPLKNNSSTLKSTTLPINQNTHQSANSLLTNTNPLLLLSLALPLLSANGNSAPLTSENLAAVQSDLFRKCPNKETMISSQEIAAWSMVVGSYMNSDRQT
ncbi:hypothetical protein M3Y97_00104700 [Aphelenchoides bicaudatus]|nr:hypothetical protein M3Y97_00104700 [Aphelenchoides bicaudatus]